MLMAGKSTILNLLQEGVTGEHILIDQRIQK
jgi:hypothetical protein